jgi:hypothetical protein
MGKTTAGLLTFVIGVLIGVCSGFYFGQNQGKDTAYNKGHDAGYANAKKDFKYKIDGYDEVLSQNSKLTTDYNDLVNQYNSLRDAAIHYVGANSYQSRAPITCNTYNYSVLNSSSTTCY